MKRVIVVSMCLFLVFSLCGCSQNDEDIDISKWDLRMIGYYEGWDDCIKDRFTVGIIDIEGVVKSDDLLIEVEHIDLLKSIIVRLSNKCDVETIILHNNPSTNELNDAILAMINKGIRVINISLGTAQEINLSDDVKQKVAENSILVICAGGNNINGLLYPALCDETISVISCDIYGIVNKDMTGVDKMSFTMPGQHINVCGSYFSGSSLSTVYCSLISAAYWAKNPELTANELVNEMKLSCINSNDHSYGVLQIDELFK